MAVEKVFCDRWGNENTTVLLAVSENKGNQKYASRISSFHFLIQSRHDFLEFLRTILPLLPMMLIKLKSISVGANLGQRNVDELQNCGFSSDLKPDSLIPSCLSFHTNPRAQIEFRVLAAKNLMMRGRPVPLRISIR